MAELIVAFDVASGHEALALAERLPNLAWAKIGPVLFVREGPDLLKEFTARGVRVFLDLKWHDIPSVVADAVASARALGAAMVTVHCLGGHDMLVAAARAAGSELAVVGVTLLTSHTPADSEQILGRGVPDLGLEASRLARLAMGAGLRGVVASGQELGMLREVLGREPWIIVPGIRSTASGPGVHGDDQSRTVTPAEAVRLGATHLVVGRPISRAHDPTLAYRQLVEAL
jgi:orotidine-5'-phosphate decarboxylase